MATWDQVRRYALALPGVVEKTSHGTAAWVVNKKLFVWERPLRKSDLAALGDAAPAGAILGIRTAEVTKGSLASTLEAVGSVAYNERDVAVVQARSNGFLERLYVRAPLDLVRKGQPLAELYVPDWDAAQEEYLSAKRIGARSDAASLAGLADAAKQRMRLAGMSDVQIAHTNGMSWTLVARKAVS